MDQLHDLFMNANRQYNDLLKQVRIAAKGLQQAAILACVSHTGLGFLFPLTLWGDNSGGSSAILGSGRQLYPESDTRRLVGWEVKAFAAPFTAAGMSSATWFEQAGTYTKAGKIDLLPRLTSMGLAGYIQKENQRPARPTISIVCHRLEEHVLKGYVVTVTAHKEQSRLDQEMIATLVALNFFLALTGREQVPIPRALMGQAYAEQGLTAQGDYYYVTPQAIAIPFPGEKFIKNGSVFITESGATEGANARFNPATDALMCGSFFPAQAAHDETATRLAEQIGKRVVIELVAENADPRKGTVATDELIRRALQFYGHRPVLIRQKCGTFLDKAELAHAEARAAGIDFATQDFAIGMDTATRLFLEAHCARYGGVSAVLERLYAAKARFHIVERATHPAEPRLPSFREFVRPFIGTPYEEMFEPLQTSFRRCPLSSSDVRAICNQNPRQAA